MLKNYWTPCQKATYAARTSGQASTSTKNEDTPDEVIVSAVPIQQPAPSLNNVQRLTIDNAILYSVESKTRIDMWFGEMDLKMQLASIPEDKKVLVIASYLKGSASRIARKYLQANDVDYQKFKAEMIVARLDSFHRVQDMNEFQSLKQVKFPTNDQYAHKFLDLADRLDLSDEHMLERLIAQVSPEYA